MMRDVLYDQAEDFLIHSLILGRVITTLLLLSKHVFANQSAQLDNIFRREFMAKISRIVTRLHFILRWTKSYAELALLYAEDLSIFNRRRHQNTPKRFRKIDDIDSDMCYSWFGLGHYDVSHLYLSWRIPDFFRASSGQVFSGEECFIIPIFHMRKGSPFIEMSETFGGDAPDFSKMFHLMIDHLYCTFYNKISGTSLTQWIPVHLHCCCQLIFDAVSSRAIEVLKQ